MRNDARREGGPDPRKRLDGRRIGAIDVNRPARRRGDARLLLACRVRARITWPVPDRIDAVELARERGDGFRLRGWPAGSPQPDAAAGQRDERKKPERFALVGGGHARSYGARARRPSSFRCVQCLDDPTRQGMWGMANGKRVGKAKREREARMDRNPRPVSHLPHFSHLPFPFFPVTSSRA